MIFILLILTHLILPNLYPELDGHYILYGVGSNTRGSLLIDTPQYISYEASNSDGIYVEINESGQISLSNNKYIMMPDSIITKECILEVDVVDDIVLKGSWHSGDCYYTDVWKSNGLPNKKKKVIELISPNQIAITYHGKSITGKEYKSKAYYQRIENDKLIRK